MMRHLLGTLAVMGALLLGTAPAYATLMLSLDAGGGPVTVIDGLDGGPAGRSGHSSMTTAVADSSMSPSRRPTTGTSVADR